MKFKNVIYNINFLLINSVIAIIYGVFLLGLSKGLNLIISFVFGIYIFYYIKNFAKSLWDFILGYIFLSGFTIFVALVSYFLYFSKQVPAAGSQYGGGISTNLFNIVYFLIGFNSYFVLMLVLNKFKDKERI